MATSNGRAGRELKRANPGPIRISASQRDVLFVYIFMRTACLCFCCGAVPCKLYGGHGLIIVV